MHPHCLYKWNDLANFILLKLREAHHQSNLRHLRDMYMPMNGAR